MEAQRSDAGDLDSAATGLKAMSGGTSAAEARWLPRGGRLGDVFPESMTELVVHICPTCTSARAKATDFGRACAEFLGAEGWHVQARQRTIVPRVVRNN